MHIGSNSKQENVESMQLKKGALHDIIPPEVIELILIFCDPADVAAFAQTARVYRSLIYESVDDHLWRSLYLSQPFDDPRTCINLLGERRKEVKWKEELHRIIRARNFMQKDKGGSECPQGERQEILEALWHMACHPAPTHRAFSEEISSNLLWVAAMLRGGKVLHSSGTTVAEQQLLAKLHTHFGITPQDMKSSARAISRAYCYDFRKYNWENNFGPFFPDGSGMVDWVHMQALHHVVSMHILDLGENEIDEDFIFTVFPMSLPFCQPIIAEGEDLDSIEDWAGISHSSEDDPPDTSIFDQPDFQEVFRSLPDVTFKVTSVEHDPDHPTRPKINFDGAMDQLHMEGYVKMTPDDQIRWHFCGGKKMKALIGLHHAENSTVHASPSSSEGVQVGGVRSLFGVLGSWTTVFHDVSDPVDPPPIKPKIGSLRDRIAAFENKPAAPSGPAPVPRPKPAGGASWKPRAVSPPPSSEPASGTASSPPRDRKVLTGMSASDAKESIGMGGSLKERMAALQGRGAFGGIGGAAAPPKPATEKPKWKPPPVVPPPADDETTPASDAGESAKSPPPGIEEVAPEAPNSSVEATLTAGEGEGESGEPDPEEEERQRRAAIAARMARLGGARVGMAPPVFGKKPIIKKPEISKDDEVTVESKLVGSSENQSTPSPLVAPSPAAIPPAGATDEEKSPSNDYFTEGLQRKSSTSSSLAATPSQTPPVKSPVSMPVPAAPRRAAPPRKKVVKSPSPVPPAKVLEDRPIEESPAAMSDSQTIVSPNIAEGMAEAGDRQAEVGQVGKSADPAIDSKQTPTEPPATMLSEGHLVAASPENTRDTGGQTGPIDAGFGTVESEIYVGESTVPDIEPTRAEELEEEDDQVPETQSIATSPPPSLAATEDEESDHGRISSEEEALAAPVPAMPEELTEEEEEATRRKRVAEKLAKMGGVNPLAPPPPRVTSPPAESAESNTVLRSESEEETLTPPATSTSSLPTQVIGGTVPPPPTRAPVEPASHDPPIPFPTALSSPADSLKVEKALKQASIDVPEDVNDEVDDPVAVASRSDVYVAPSDSQESYINYAEDNQANHELMGGEASRGFAERRETEEEWAPSDEEDEEATPAAIARTLPPPPPNMNTRPHIEDVIEKRPSQGSKRESIPPPPRPPPSAPYPEADSESGSSPPIRSIPPPPSLPPATIEAPRYVTNSTNIEESVSTEEPPIPPRRAVPPSRRQSAEISSTSSPAGFTSPPFKRASMAPSAPSGYALAGADVPWRTSTPPAPTSPPSKRGSVVPPVPAGFALTGGNAPSRTSTPPVPTSPPSRRTSTIPPVPGSFSHTSPPRGDYPPPPPASVTWSAASYEEPAAEVLDEEEGDPIDPGFHSPTRTPPAHSQPLPMAPPPPPLPAGPSESHVESAPQEDHEHSRRRGIAERMAKLGGIKFGAPPPIGRPSPISPATNEIVRTEEIASVSPQEEQSEEMDLDEEEEERARKERIAAKLAGMGGVGMFGAPPPRPPPAPRVRREDSEDTIQAAQSPPPLLSQRTVPTPSAIQNQDSGSEFEDIGTSGTSDDGVKVEAEESEPEEVHPEDVKEEPAPPAVPSRAGRRSSGVMADYQPRRSMDAPPPLPGGRPPVPVSAASRQSSVRKSSTESYSSPSTRRISLDVPQAATPSIASPSDYVMVEEPEEAPPLPPSRPNRGPPSRPPPPPRVESTAGSSRDMPSSSPMANLDGPPLDLSLASSMEEESTSSYIQAPARSIPPPPAPTAPGLENTPLRPPALIPQDMSSDDLMAVWGRVGVQICEVATTLFEKSKKSLIGDGSYHGFLRAVFSQVPNAMMPTGNSEFGYLIYAQTGSAVQRRASDIMPGDVVALYDAKLKGHKGLQSYHQHVGAEEPLLGIVSDFEMKKSKVKVFHANQHVGQQTNCNLFKTVESVSYRLEDLKSGAVKTLETLESFGVTADDFTIVCDRPDKSVMWRLHSTSEATITRNRTIKLFKMIARALIKSRTSISYAASRFFTSPYHRRTFATPTCTRHNPLFSMEDKVRLEEFVIRRAEPDCVQVCLVTGAAQGLGYQFCKAFVNAGCTKLAILDLKEQTAEDAARQLLTEVTSSGCRLPEEFQFLGLGCDVSSEASIHSAYKTTMEKFGRLDSVVASAGIVENFPAVDYPLDRAKKLYDINVHGVFCTAREAAQVMIPRGGGSIILVSSMSANIVNIPEPQTPYNASKAAVKHMAESLAVEWATTGVRVNVISPGYTLTKLTKTMLADNKELKKRWEELTPMARMGKPEDLDGAIVFLASNASEYCTGTELRVDGGYCLI
ncbi:hypothetical protein HWV62_37414 [Athelia sp. TMB]|nr:hypothetical protein HWV62_37414 [Athelia sp. TMB]